MNNYNYDFLEKKVLEWAKARGLLNSDFRYKQALKFFSEAGELADSLAKGQDCRDDLGDILVTLIILANQLGVDLINCLEIAYGEIKDRQGLTVNGAFIKGLTNELQ